MCFTFPWTFPDFNIHSGPLLILVLQGLIFVTLLFIRYFKQKRPSDLFLALLLFVVCYEQICYTVGFMGWYNTYRNTKINYWLIPMTVGIAPLIYWYVKSITTSNFKFKKRDLWHFSPAILLVVYRIIIFTYDALQPGFQDTQNGYLKIHVDEAFGQILISFLGFTVMLLYLAFTFQLFYQYRKKINAYFSNTFKLELNWILSFLIVFTMLFLYDSVQTFVSSLLVEMSYTQQYWLNIFMALIVLYVGVRGYFTDTSKLQNINFDFSPTSDTIKINTHSSNNIEKEVLFLKDYMNNEKPYLDPELNLISLSKKLNFSRAKLSEIINDGFEKNFNDFVNTYRVNAVKSMLEEGKQNQLSLLGIALECGFNSKATFNRVFKKLTQQSPTQYVASVAK